MTLKKWTGQKEQFQSYNFSSHSVLVHNKQLKTTQ